MTLHDDTFNDVVQVAQLFHSHKSDTNQYEVAGQSVVFSAFRHRNLLAKQVMFDEFVQVLKRDVIYRQELENVFGKLNILPNDAFL